MLSPAQRLGRAIEEEVCAYLTKQGLKLVVANYMCKFGEIDLVMQDGETLVFVEVRYRVQDDFGSALESITRGKQRKVIRAAKCYLLENDLWEKVPCRFDAVVMKAAALEDERVYWVKDAFWA